MEGRTTTIYPEVNQAVGETERLSRYPILPLLLLPNLNRNDMRRFKFVGDPSDYDWNVELIKNYIYNEDVELNGFMGILSTLEMAKDQDANDPILADLQEVFDQPNPLHKDTDLGYFAGLAMRGLLSIYDNNQECGIVPNRQNVKYMASLSVLAAKELIKQLDKEVGK